MINRRRWIGLAKLAVVAGLLAFVLSTIHWRDRLLTHRGDAVESTVTGRVLGAWDEAEVRFRPLAADGREGAELTVRPGAQPDGTRIDVQPGFLTYVRNIDWWLFALGAACYFVSASFAAVRWWWLLRANGLAVTLFEAWRFTWIGVFFNNVVPGQTGGDVVKALYIIKHCRDGNRVAAGVSVIVDRILGLGSLALLAAVVVLFALERFALLALGIWGVLIGVGVIGVVAFSRRIRRAVRLDAILNRLPLSGLLKRIDQAVYAYRRHKTGIGLWIVAGTLSHVLSVLSVALIGQAMAFGFPMVDYFVLVPIINIVSAVPLGPNGWGVGEFLYGSMFAIYGSAPVSLADPALVMRTRGVALSLVYRIHLSLWSLLGGLLMLFEKDKVTHAEVEAELEAEEAAAS